MWDTTFEKILRNQLPFLPAAEALDSEAELKDLGLDSMGMVALLSDLESSYGVRFTDDALDASTFATPGVLWRTLGGIREKATAA
ncbi:MULTISPECIES: phosphopantetheine-binding protein [Streptomyces]|uniref:Phosphopantetheine-binding protein n=1 Tax=Streptomyces lienomycini TaxID=284035 RepID=A0ABV9X6K7_9ACTN|nr:phosphopantetheine-binding protein [Streptomyces sp. NBC_00334]